MKLCYCACLKHLIGLIKSKLANRKAGKRIGWAVRQAVRRNRRRKRGIRKQERLGNKNKERKTLGASHPDMQPVME